MGDDKYKEYRCRILVIGISIGLIILETFPQIYVRFLFLVAVHLLLSMLPI